MSSFATYMYVGVQTLNTFSSTCIGRVRTACRVPVSATVKMAARVITWPETVSVRQVSTAIAVKSVANRVSVCTVYKNFEHWSVFVKDINNCVMFLFLTRGIWYDKQLKGMQQREAYVNILPVQLIHANSVISSSAWWEGLCKR